jgi:nucleotide-binding universal stress UspA family protein
MNSTADASVVVGVDGSTESRAAVDVAAWEAYRRGVPLRLVHGYQPGGYGASGPMGTVRKRLDAEAERVRSRYPGLSTTTIVVSGDPGTILVDEARSAVLTVVGARGVSSFHSTLLGSVADQVATRAPAAVIVVRPPDPGRRPRVGVVVAIDASPAMATAVEFAFEEAGARGTDLTAIDAWTPGATDPATAQQEAEHVLAEALAGWPDKYPQVELFRRAVPGRTPVRALLEEAADAELVVVGAGPPGSTANGLVHHAQTSVAVVPACARR